MEEPKFLTSSAKDIFNLLQQAFTKALILQYLDLECYIRIESDTLRYAIRGILSQLTSDKLTSNTDQTLTKPDFSQWHLVVYFFRKMIFVET